MTSQATIYIGHSHVYSIQHANTAIRLSEYPVHSVNVIGEREFVNYASIVNDERIFDPDILRTLDTDLPIYDQGLFVAMFGGNAHNAVGIFEHALDYDFWIWGEPHDPSRYVITAGMMRDIILNEAAAALEHISLLRKARPQPIIAMCSPPPIMDNEYIATHLGPGLRHLKPDGIIARPELRRKLWLLHTEIFRTHCSSVGVPFLPPPPETMTDAGFLRPEYWADATHANEAYGALLIELANRYRDEQRNADAINDPANVNWQMQAI